MGQILSRVRKKPSTAELLEELEKEIENLEEYRRTTVQQQKRFIGSLLFYSVFLYLFVGVVAFIYWSSSNLRTQIICIVPLVSLPLLIWLFKRFCQWYFRRKLEYNTDSLSELLRKRRTILNDVKEKETYKKAKEILEKFDPDYKKKKREEEAQAAAAAAAAQAQKIMGTPRQDMRRRPMSARGGFRGHGRGGTPPPSVSSAVMPAQTPVGVTFSMNGQQWPRPSGPPLPRPILPREPKIVDRFVDFLIGDGPSNRYALICQRCLSHNGMALKEEFEYISFRCCYCYFLNPPRKVRPFAPRLPSTPIPAIALPPQVEDSQDSVTESDSETHKASDESGIQDVKEEENLNEQTVKISEIKDDSEPETTTDSETVSEEIVSQLKTDETIETTTEATTDHTSSEATPES